MMTDDAFRRLMKALMALFFVALVGFVIIVAGQAFELTWVPRIGGIITAIAIFLGLALLAFGIALNAKRTLIEGFRSLGWLKREVDEMTGRKR